MWSCWQWHILGLGRYLSQAVWLRLGHIWAGGHTPITNHGEFQTLPFLYAEVMQNTASLGCKQHKNVHTSEVQTSPDMCKHREVTHVYTRVRENMCVAHQKLLVPITFSVVTDTLSTGLP